MRRGAPIFVVGFQRSGTTLLQSTLGAHPRIAAPPEMHYFFRVANLADYFGDLADDDNLRRALHELLDAPSGILDDCGFDEDALFSRLQRGERSYRALLDEVMADFAARHGKARWSEKTPSQPAAWVYQVFPDAQVVHIVRDPRAVVASCLETPWHTSGALGIALAWRRFTLSNIRAGLAAGPGHFLQVRYEDLTREPEVVLRVVCTFLGEDFDPPMVTDPGRRTTTLASSALPWQRRVLEPFAAPDLEEWRSRLGRRPRLQVNAAVRHELAALGYDPPHPRRMFVGCGLNVAERAALSARARLHRHPPRTAAARYEQMRRYLSTVEASVAQR